MVDFVTALREMLHQRVEDRGIVGLAIAVGPSARPQALWVPRSLDEEPGFLAYRSSRGLAFIRYDRH